MKSIGTRKAIAAAVAAGALAIGGGAAVAATGLGSPGEESAAIIDDAAEELGVEPSELSAALKQALTNRVDAALAAGTITAHQAAGMKERIAADDYPLVGFGHGRGGHHGPGHGIELTAAAEYLGLTEAELREALDEETSLADVAEAEGKSVDGLVDALVAATTERLQEEVDAGRITDERRDEILATLRKRIEERIDDPLPAHRGEGPRM
jgi:hypothetical protein